MPAARELSILYHQYPKDRLTEPLKRVGDRFEPIPWEQAIDEIAEKMSEMAEKHGPRSDRHPDPPVCAVPRGGGLNSQPVFFLTLAAHWRIFQI